MNRDDIIRMAREAGDCFRDSRGREEFIFDSYGIERFANLVAAAEREKVAHWMMTACYATGHGDTTEDLLRELAWQADERIVKAVAAEREACVEEIRYYLAHSLTAKDILNAIRERGEK